MGDRQQLEQSFPSTTWAWKRVKIARAPQAGTSRPKGGRWHHLPRWDRRTPLTVTLRHSGGAESWWQIKARGSTGYVPGHLALEDVMRIVLSEV